MHARTHARTHAHVQHPESAESRPLRDHHPRVCMLACMPGRMLVCMHWCRGGRSTNRRQRSVGRSRSHRPRPLSSSNNNPTQTNANPALLVNSGVSWVRLCPSSSSCSYVQHSNPVLLPVPRPQGNYPRSSEDHSHRSKPLSCGVLSAAIGVQHSTRAAYAQATCDIAFGQALPT